MMGSMRLKDKTLNDTNMDIDTALENLKFQVEFLDNLCCISKIFSV